MTTAWRRAAVAWALWASGPLHVHAGEARTESFALRGVPQTLHLYGPTGGPVAIVASGDGGWVHLAPDVAAMLARRGYRVVGFDSKAYLASFTSRTGPLSPEDVPRDFQALLARAAGPDEGRALLVGVSEGAGLSVLAATSPAVRARIAGVVALGLPDRNELGWRWRDCIIYVTKKVPDEPAFSVRTRVAQMAPAPLAAIHSLHDEFVPEDEIRAILEHAREPKRLWTIDATDHRFGGARDELDRRLGEAIAWIGAAGP